MPLEAVHPHDHAVLLRTVVIALTAFLTVVDLFATQAILPSLARAYQVTPATMGIAVNACTIGMAIAGLAVALISSRINRRLGILVSLVVLSIPTSLLGLMPELPAAISSAASPAPPFSGRFSTATVGLPASPESP
jgi:predicted MFS family arabinose efflux permease